MNIAWMTATDAKRQEDLWISLTRVVPFWCMDNRVYQKKYIAGLGAVSIQMMDEHIAWMTEQCLPGYITDKEGTILVHGQSILTKEVYT